MLDELPDHFDLVVIGTGFVESCIAAAASRVGKSVLHIDNNEYYGDVWASFSIKDLCERLNKEYGSHSTLRNGTYTWHTTGEGPGTTALVDPGAEIWNRENILKESRRFSLDLCPRILYASGELVQLLIKSNICRYAEFRAVDHVCMRHNGEIVSVPCSRSDVFNTKTLTIVEKRLLMKFLTACNDYGADKCNEDSLAFRGRTFLEYLQAQRVTEKISSCVMQAIAMCGPNTSFEEGMKRTQRFLGSLGRYGNTPFLFPMYGCGELPQCFCRLCAVYGGIYCLQRKVEDIGLDEKSKEFVLYSGEKTVRATNVVSGSGCPPVSRGTEMKPHISRGLFVSASPLGNQELNKGGGGVNFLRLLDAEGVREAILIQLAHYTGACPNGLYIFHLTTPAISEDPASDLAVFASQLFDQSDAQILFSSYFTIACQSSRSTAAEHIYYTDGPTYELDYDAAIANARAIFGKLYPDADFLPRAPDPDEIVVDGEDPSALNEHSLPEDLRAQLQSIQQATQEMDIQD